MTIIHEYNDIAATIWPMQPLRQDTTMSTHLKPPISRAGLTQIGRLAKLRNERKSITNLHPDTANDHAHNPVHINIKINQIRNPITSISTAKAHKQCPKAIGKIVKKASEALLDNLRDKKNKDCEESPKHCYNNLKIQAGLLPRARDQPRVLALTNPGKMRS
jgi:hypothetical protein